MSVALVLGSAGFLGRHFVSELIGRGWDVAGVDLVYRTGRAQEKLFSSGPDALSIFASRDAPRFDLIIHAAASSPHREAIDHEPVHMARNLQLDAALFDWAARTGQGRILYFSSSAAYPVQRQWLRREAPVARHCDGQGRLAEDMIDLDWVEEPDTVYGWVKLTGERLARQARAFGLPVTVVRPFSGYGEDQSENFPFRALVERARRRENPFTIWGDGTQVRDWVHVDDVVAGALAIAEAGTTETLNICTGLGTSMTTLAVVAAGIVGYDPDLEFRLDKPAGVAYRVGDPARLHRFYTPKISLHEGLHRALRG